MVVPSVQPSIGPREGQPKNTPTSLDLSRFYIEGGLPVSPHTGRAHTVFKHDPSTLRLSSAAPNLQNIPRGSTDLQKLIRGFFVAAAGYTFWARDFSGIEAVLVGFFANAARYIRLAKLDIHSFFTAYALYELEKKIKFEDLPQESWPDDQLRASLKAIKSAFGEQRNTNKKLTHGRNYKETAAMAQIILLNELGVLMPVKDISKVMDFYDELFPEIPNWHLTLAAEVGGVAHREGVPKQRWGYKARNCVVTNPFGFSHRYYDAVEWEKTPTGWDWSLGPDAKRLIAFLPQSTARFIKTRAAQRIFYDPEYQDVAQTFRLFVHDEILGECLPEQLERCLLISKQEQERPIPELVMPDGSLLSLGTEAKTGPVWGEMKEAKGK